MSVTAGVNDATIVAIREKLRGKISQTKVKRYWPGKAPEWADEQEEDDDLRTSSSRNSRAALEQAFPSDELSSADDPRLRRLAESRAVDRDEIRADHRRIRQAEIVSTAEDERLKEEEEEEDDEDAVEERRRRIRERALLRVREEERELPTVEEDEEEEGEREESSEEESEYETDSEDDEFGGRRALAKPVFVPKSERETIAERERIEAEERALEEAVKRRIEERKVETRQIVVEKIREAEEVQKNQEAEADIGDIDTDDELNEEDYEKWKAREIARIRRDREDKEAVVKEREEIERVRNMSEEERREWERKNPKPGPAPKQKWRFMQKYYHKGAFFQEDADDRTGTAGSDSIYRRDFSEPTGEDKLDKTILPKVMQVKHFGRSGRTKWTHLVNEDTTDWNNQLTENDSLRAKYYSKMAGMRPIAKPKGSRKLKDWEQR